MSQIAPFSSASLPLPGIVDAIDAAQQARDYIRQGNYEYAKIIIDNHLYAISTFRTQRTFDALLETVLEDATNTNRLEQGAKFCEILIERGLSSDFITLIYPACLIALERGSEATTYIDRNGYSLGELHRLVLVYTTLTKQPMITLLDGLARFMN